MTVSTLLQLAALACLLCFFGGHLIGRWMEAANWRQRGDEATGENARWRSAYFSNGRPYYIMREQDYNMMDAESIMFRALVKAKRDKKSLPWRSAFVLLPKS